MNMKIYLKKMMTSIKDILIDRNEIEEKVYEFNFFDEETGELIWSYYGDYDYNVAKTEICRRV